MGEEVKKHSLRPRCQSPDSEVMLTNLGHHTLNHNRSSSYRRTIIIRSSVKTEDLREGAYAQAGTIKQDDSR